MVVTHAETINSCEAARKWCSLWQAFKEGGNRRKGNCASSALILLSVWI
jgi:hypothetical protein